ncbi:hypothetical protein PHYSODRAFT_262945 [Phytophthora sojae]|uniref:Uncharacterized protein n=1 Tax=Phytophthora sojae (strain P6497) TaxID=1094619 RepID=G4ZLD4_PHYSP|nr:hypothetical protein PHYSODRAFT_262945 [Phytophthora sojae]EGZ15980.1 hypothetical protein PHYSODRAFT_262945 [Phytophthora sojae]|eukprot:XP_009529729.1 hypothetical protein PHYSODRAFT_262945 [Phytophthora sojae]
MLLTHLLRLTSWLLLASLATRRWSLNHRLTTAAYLPPNLFVLPLKSRNNELLLLAPDDSLLQQERDQDQEQHSEDDDKEQLQARQREDMDMNSRTPIAFEADLLAERTLFLVTRSSSYAALIAGAGGFNRSPRGPVNVGEGLPAGSILRVHVQRSGGRYRIVDRVSFRFGSSGYSSDNSDELRRGSCHHRRLREGEEQRRLTKHTPLGAEKYELGSTHTFDNLALGSKADDYSGVVNTMKGNPCEDPVTPLILGTAPPLLHVCHSYEADDSS